MSNFRLILPLFAAVSTLICLVICVEWTQSACGDQPHAVTRSISSAPIGPYAGPLAGHAIYANSYALLIGINRYPRLSPLSQLHYAVADVDEIKRVLVTYYGFPASHVVVLTDSQARKAALLKALAKLTDPNAIGYDDRIFVYFSGHGVTAPLPNGGESGFLAPSDANIETVPAGDRAGVYGDQCLSMQTLWQTLSTCPAKHVLMMVDACYAGILTQERAIGLEQPGIALAAEHRALEVITAGRSTDESMETAALGHGVFSAKFIGLLRQYAAEKPGFAVSAHELYGDLYGLVANYPQSHELPQMGSFGTDGDFLFIAHPSTSSSPAPTALLPLPEHGRILTRYLAARLFARFIDQSPDLSASATNMRLAQFDEGPSFSDVPNDSEYYPDIVKLLDMGIIIGDPDDSFGGKRLMPRYEFAMVLARVLDLYRKHWKATRHPVPVDVSNDVWYFNAVNRILDAGAMTLDSDGRFLGGDSMTVDDGVGILKDLAAKHGYPLPK